MIKYRLLEFRQSTAHCTLTNSTQVQFFFCFFFFSSVSFLKFFHTAAARRSVEMCGVAVLPCVLYLPHRTGQVYLQKHHMTMFKLASVLSLVLV